VRLGAERGRSEDGAIGEIIAVEPLGAETHVVVRVGALVLRAIAHGFETYRRGDSVRVAIDPARVTLFDADEMGGARLR
jgi:multiple sugar transport system ATP-binding protein